MPLVASQLLLKFPEVVPTAARNAFFVSMLGGRLKATRKKGKQVAPNIRNHPQAEKWFRLEILRIVETTQWSKLINDVNFGYFAFVDISVYFVTTNTNEKDS